MCDEQVPNKADTVLHTKHLVHFHHLQHFTNKEEAKKFDEYLRNNAFAAETL